MSMVDNAWRCGTIVPSVNRVSARSLINPDNCEVFDSVNPVSVLTFSLILIHILPFQRYSI